ncbi:hypothetical protein LMB52_09335 [Limosilactobacillus reuteri]|nr:hypothetical protein [Limosilactobacillus reuteri]MCC4470033.1 hypothetical protein [Limosilactobacillus reuteri]
MIGKLGGMLGRLAALAVMVGCVCIVGLLIDGALAANIWLWHWIISALF